MYADSVNLWVHTTEKSTDILLMASVEVTAEVNTEKTKYKLMSCNQTAR